MKWSNLDGFHVFKELGHWFMAAFGFMYITHFSELMAAMPLIDSPVLFIVVSWFIKGAMFNLFYHIVFIKSEFWAWPVPFTNKIVSIVIRGRWRPAIYYSDLDDWELICKDISITTARI